MGATDIFPLEPDYPIDTDWLTDGIVRARLQNGRIVSRLQRPPQRIFSLSFRNLTTAEKTTLFEWWRQHETGWFIFQHTVHSIQQAGMPDAKFLSRSFAVSFMEAPPDSLSGFETYLSEIRLVEEVGRALDTYPDPAVHESKFLQESDGNATAGVWTTAAQVLANGGSEATNPNTNTTDTFRWVYAGYGFQLRSRKGSGFGTVKVLLDGVDLGNIDLSAAGDVPSQPVLTKLDVTLGIHTLDLQATTIGGIIIADALEVAI